MLWGTRSLVLLLASVALASGSSASAVCAIGKTNNGSLVAEAKLSPSLCGGAQNGTVLVQAVVHSQFVYQLCSVHCPTVDVSCSAILHEIPSNEVQSASLYGVYRSEGVEIEEPPTSVALLCKANVSDGLLSSSSSTSAAFPLTSAQPYRVGALFEGWHTFAATAMANVSAQGGAQYTVEDVIQSNGGITLSDILDKYNLRSASDGFFYHAKPSELGFYCIYRKRAGEAGIVPDCPNITQTLTVQAQQLTSAGVDYVAMDGTNLGSPSREAEAIQVRPTEVLFEEWSALRKQGISTPDIAVWQVSPAGSTLWQNALALYNNYTDMVLTDKTGKLVFFVPANTAIPPDPTILAGECDPRHSLRAGVVLQSVRIAEIASNGGRNNVVVVQMWANLSPQQYSGGEWAFMSPCVDPASGAHTTNVVGAGISPCGQQVTTNSPIGSAITVCPSYQLQYSSLPFGAAGKFGGLTFKRQFGGLLQLVGTPSSPDYVFMSSWNELIAQPQPNPFNSPDAFSMGLPTDPQGPELWVDTYGASISRDICPTDESGSVYYDIMSSCLSVARLGAVNGGLGGPLSAPCTVAGELCCEYNETTDGFVNVWSMAQASPGADRLLTIHSEEVKTLVARGWGTEVCNPIGGPTLFCVNSALYTSKDPLALQGPFVLASGCGPGCVYSPLYRCLRSDGIHFFSPRADCEGEKMESLLGYTAPKRSTNFPRALQRCHHLKDSTAAEYYYHTLDGGCVPPDASEGAYGFVH